MPLLRAHRRDRRARAHKVRRRRNLAKFVPSSDSDFAMTSRGFAQYVWTHRETLGISDRDAEYLGRLVKHFREALAKATSPLTRNKPAVTAKNNWRKEAEQWLRMIGGKIRTDPTVEPSHKRALRLIDLPSRKTESACPQRPPVLQFIGACDGVDGSVGAGNGSGVHVLRVFDVQTNPRKPDCGVVRKARPDGAAGIELSIGFIPQDVRVPGTVHEYIHRGFGWPLFHRRYTTMTVEVKFPMPDRPMLIVYWARWTNNAGDQGRYCKTCIGRVEGWPKGIGKLLEPAPASRVSVQHGAQYALPAMEPKLLEGQRMHATYMLIGTPLALPKRTHDGEDDDVDVDIDALLREQRMLPASVVADSPSTHADAAPGA